LNNRVVGWTYGSCKYYNMRMLVIKKPDSLSNPEPINADYKNRPHNR